MKQETIEPVCSTAGLGGITTGRMLELLDMAAQAIPNTLATTTITATPLQLSWVLGKLAEDARHQIDEVVRAIPGYRYMDPPDGGDVSLGEQVRRMAEHIEQLEKLLGDVSYETRQYSEGFELLWDRVDAALWGVGADDVTPNAKITGG